VPFIAVAACFILREGIMKKGFGILEVIVASLVLSFLMLGLLYLQIGNREAIIRIRARDAANFVAQHVLDSLGMVGINSLQAKADCSDDNLVYCEDNYIYSFAGKTGTVQLKYNVKVELLADDAAHSSRDSTGFTKAIKNENSMANERAGEVNIYNKKLEATVSWPFKKSTQSIKVAKLVR
jgi:type II secretory pathway pseudopilin PulG